MDESEIGSGAVKAVAAYFGLKGLDRLLGPTLDLYGEGLRDCAAAGNKNLKRIFEKALRKLGNEIEKEGQIPPRIFNKLIEEAPYCEDDLVQEYLAGIVVASRSRNSGDNLIHHAALIKRLSSLQIRMHYCIYRMFYDCYKYSGLRMNVHNDRMKMPIFLSSGYPFHTRRH